MEDPGTFTPIRIAGSGDADQIDTVGILQDLKSSELRIVELWMKMRCCW